MLRLTEENLSLIDVIEQVMTLASGLYTHDEGDSG